MNRLSLASTASLLAAAQVGCGLFGPGLEEFVIQVDSVTGPTSVPAATAFQQFFYGAVGPNGCYGFKAFRVVRSPGAADVTAVGQQSTGALCTQAPVYLQREPLTIDPPASDPFTLRVHQGDGTVLTRTIRIQ